MKNLEKVDEYMKHLNELKDFVDARNLDIVEVTCLFCAYLTLHYVANPEDLTPIAKEVTLKMIDKAFHPTSHFMDGGNARNEQSNDSRRNRSSLEEGECRSKGWL
jgi:hypothetical protein